MPLLQLLHLLRVPRDAVHRPWAYEARRLAKSRGDAEKTSAPHRLLLYSLLFRAGLPPSHDRRSSPDLTRASVV